MSYTCIYILERDDCYYSLQARWCPNSLGRCTYGPRSASSTVLYRSGQSASGRQAVAGTGHPLARGDGHFLRHRARHAAGNLCPWQGGPLSCGASKEEVGLLVRGVEENACIDCITVRMYTCRMRQLRSWVRRARRVLCGLGARDAACSRTREKLMSGASEERGERAGI